MKCQAYVLPNKLAKKIDSALQEWRIEDKVTRLWNKDVSLWTNSDENKWMGWLGLTEDRKTQAGHLESICEEIKQAEFKYILLLGMGGSSLFPEVLKNTFGKIKEYPELFVLDSTDPAQVLTLDKKLDLARTLCIVSSKSGSTLEPNVFMQYFFDRMKQTVGAEAGKHFIAVTDPGSKLEKTAKDKNFRHIFYGLPSVGGRFSALSNFGMVPAAAMGMDVADFLERAEEMVKSCASGIAPKENPGVVLGVMMGVLANQGINKLTIVTSPRISGFGAWLEQLVAESTGKDGKCIIPVDQESLGPTNVYGRDRFFAYIRLESEPDSKQDQAIDDLEKAGHPVVRISMIDIYDLGKEVFRWEVATAVAGSIMGIHPFNQPDVEASKIETRKLTSEYEKTGAFHEDSSLVKEIGIKLFADTKNVEELNKAVGENKSLRSYLSAHLSRFSAGDYFSILAYIEMNRENCDRLQTIRHAIRDSKGIATCLGFGPRFLHSTGQAYKGGSNTGVFLQITCDDAKDLSIPGEPFSFGVVKTAQARGDLEVLIKRDRRILRVHLDKNVKQGLKKLEEVIKQILSASARNK